MFDVRCAVSGLSTQCTRSEEHGTESTCSMVLLEEVEGQWLPFTPPVSGAYDHYGHVEVWLQAVNEHTDHVVERLDELRASGALVLREGERFDKKKSATEWYLDGSRRPIPKITTWLSMTNAFEGDALTLEGRSVMGAPSERERGLEFAESGAWRCRWERGSNKT